MRGCTWQNYVCDCNWCDEEAMIRSLEAEFEKQIHVPLNAQNSYFEKHLQDQRRTQLQQFQANMHDQLNAQKVEFEKRMHDERETQNQQFQATMNSLKAEFEKRVDDQLNAQKAEFQKHMDDERETQKLETEAQIARRLSLETAALKEQLRRDYHRMSVSFLSRCIPVMIMFSLLFACVVVLTIT